MKTFWTLFAMLVAATVGMTVYDRGGSASTVSTSVSTPRLEPVSTPKVPPVAAPVERVRPASSEPHANAALEVEDAERKRMGGPSGPRPSAPVGGADEAPAFASREDRVGPGAGPADAPGLPRSAGHAATERPEMAADSARLNGAAAPSDAGSGEEADAASPRSMGSLEAPAVVADDAGVAQAGGDDEIEVARADAASGETVGAEAAVSDAPRASWDTLNGFPIPGSGTAEDPFVVSWDLLDSVARDYAPRNGLDTLPAWVGSLDGRHVRIEGYLLLPMNGATDEVLAMRNQWDGCCLGMPPTPYNAVEVSLAEPMPVGLAQQHAVMNYGALEGRFKADPYVISNFLMGLWIMEEATLTMEPVAGR